MDTRSAFLRALAEIEPGIASAFEEVISDVRLSAKSRALEEAMERALRTGDISRGYREVLEIVRMGPGIMSPLQRAVESAYLAGALYQQNSMIGSNRNPGPVLFRFSSRNKRAEEWVRTRSASLVSEISEDVRQSLRDTLDEALREGLGYRHAASQFRSVIGLHSRQSAAVRTAQTELRSLSFAYFDRERRDRRFDGLVRRAIRSGEPIQEDKIQQITARYADRLRRLRADTVARTEGNAAMNAARFEAVTQLVESGEVSPERITKIWDSVSDIRTRETHIAMRGQEVPWLSRFISPSGALLMHPHDQSAPASEVINCRCSMRIQIDWR
jgi:hypothetical protein